MNKDKNHSSPLDNASLKKIVFQVPTDYFDQLEGSIMDRINAEEGELANVEHLKKNIFEVPHDYFNQLEGRIKEGISTEAGELTSNEHLKTPVFEVPKDYFNTLEAKITEKLEEKEATKVIPLHQRNWFRFAVAAVIIVGIFLGTQDTSPGIETSELSSELMIDYLSEESDYDYELMAMTNDFESIIDNILIDETSLFAFGTESNLELEYDFEYFDH